MISLGVSQCLVYCLLAINLTLQKHNDPKAEFAKRRKKKIASPPWIGHHRGLSRFDKKSAGSNEDLRKENYVNSAARVKCFGLVFASKV